MTPPGSTAGDKEVWLLEQLAVRWTDGNAAVLVRHLSEVLGCNLTCEPREVQNAVRFRLDLSCVYLGGMGERVGSILVGGAGKATEATLEQFAREVGGGGLGFPLAFCVTESAYRAARQALPERFSVAISPADLAALFVDAEPLRALTRQAATQVSRLALSVYTVLRPAEVAFFGREREQKLLFDDVRSSYAIAGPGRIGKSSLMKRHARNLRRRRDSRMARLFELDFMHLGDANDDEVARYIATQLRGGRRSERVTAPDLARFLRECRSESDGPLEMLLDETDLVCEGEAFKQLGHAAKQGHARLVLGGRKRLYDYASRESSLLGQRLVLLRLQPLREADAANLVRLPLEALGVSLRPDADVCHRILDRTGRLPHLIQFYAKNLIELTSDHHCNEITPELLDELEDRDEFPEMFLAPLEELSERPAFALACELLRGGRDRFETADVCAAAARIGQPCGDATAARRACDELVIANILAWDHGGYRIATPMIRDAARRAGLLD